MYIDIATIKVSLPLSADLEVSFEVDAVHAELAASRGVMLLQTRAAVLSMKGRAEKIGFYIIILFFSIINLPHK